RGGFRRLALANPALAPYGRAAVQVLAVLDPGGALREHLVQGENVGQTFQFVSTANAELGFVALSQVRQPGSDGWRAGSAWLIPETLHDPIEQDVVWLKQAENSKAVPALLDFIRSPEGRAIIVAHGYEPGFDDQ
ncbi:MAG TPA: molybdate ABC transporter substrate-binding protein, partial [Pseudomonadaceae bacterium]|nr:molybdate ABC transporter substrate-binding protein [Pseudomonadaceae bacterium]